MSFVPVGVASPAAAAATLLTRTSVVVKIFVDGQSRDVVGKVYVPFEHWIQNAAVDAFVVGDFIVRSHGGHETPEVIDPLSSANAGVGALRFGSRDENKVGSRCFHRNFRCPHIQ